MMGLLLFLITVKIVVLYTSLAAGAASLAATCQQVRLVL